MKTAHLSDKYKRRQFYSFHMTTSIQSTRLLRLSHVKNMQLSRWSNPLWNTDFLCKTLAFDWETWVKQDSRYYRTTPSPFPSFLNNLLHWNKVSAHPGIIFIWTNTGLCASVFQVLFTMHWDKICGNTLNISL